MGHLTFLSKRPSAVGNKRISHFFASAGEPRSRVIALVDSTRVFLLLSFYIVISWNVFEYEGRNRYNVEWIFEGVLYFGWPNQPSSGTWNVFCLKR